MRSWSEARSEVRVRPLRFVREGPSSIDWPRNGRCAGVLLVLEVDRARSAAAGGLPPAGLGFGERPGRGSGDPGQQPPLVRRLAVHAAHARRAGSPSWPRRSTSTRPGIKGWFQKRFFSGAGQVPDRPLRRVRRRGRDDRGQADARRGRAVRHLPRGHPLARRHALPRQDRRRPARARDRASR